MKKRLCLLIALLSLILIQALSMSGALGASASAGSGEWTMFRQDPSHSGYAASSPSANSAQLLWNYSTGRMVQSSPAFAYGLVVVGSRDSQVYCFNASTGIKIWSYPFRTSDSSSPAVDNGCVYIGSYDGYIFALNASTGAQVWKYRTADEVESSPAFAYGCIYVGSEDNSVYCLNGSSGSKIWQSSTGYWVTSSPAVAGGNVYVGSQDDNIYCFNATTGAKEWSYPTGNSVESSPAIANNVLYIGSDDSKVYALELTNSTGSPQPSQTANSIPLTTVVFDAIACVIGAIAIFALARHAYVTRRKNRNNESSTPRENQSWLQRHADAVCILAILAFSAIFFVNLGSGVLQTTDEQTYSQWAYHMVKTGDYLTPWLMAPFHSRLGSLRC